MHIPDGFLDLSVIVATYALAAIFWVIASIKTKRALGEKEVPLLSIMTAGVFAAQLINFPIIGGTSGHLIGGTLIAILFGPYAAVVSMTVILVIQAFVFGDGGVTALGANVFNMGVVAVFSGYLIYKGIASGATKGKRVLFASFVAAYMSVVLGALACGLEIGVSSNFPYGVNVTVPLMVLWHLVIGVGEGLITLLVLASLLRSRPELLSSEAGK
nr:energy-coupling factor ABC transporter permease [Candidatus Njordarchaeum guaymaensis]